MDTQIETQSTVVVSDTTEKSTPSTDATPSTDNVETTTCQANEDILEEDAVSDEDEVCQEDDDENSTIYIVRVNDNISGFSYDRESAVNWVQSLSKLLLMRDTSSYKTYTEEVDDDQILIYGSYRFMNLLSYDRVLYRITCEPVDQL